MRSVSAACLLAFLAHAQVEDALVDRRALAPSRYNPAHELDDATLWKGGAAPIIPSCCSCRRCDACSASARRLSQQDQQLVTVPGQGRPDQQLATVPDQSRPGSEERPSLVVGTASWDRSVKLWGVIGDDPTVWEEIVTFADYEFGVMSIAFSPDGTKLATSNADRKLPGNFGAAGGIAKLWGIAGPSPWADLGRLEGHQDWVHCVAFSPDGTMLATAGWDWNARIWNVSGEPSTWKQLLVLRGHMTRVYSLAWSPDGDKIVTGGWDNTVRIYNASVYSEEGYNQHKVFRVHKNRVQSVAWSPDGTKVASGCWDSTARIFNVSDEDPANWTELTSLQAHTGMVMSVAFSPDSTKVATASWDRTVIIWDISSDSPSEWKVLANLSKHNDSVLSVTFSQDGSKLATSGWDDTAMIWDISDGMPSNWELLATLRGHAAAINSVAFSPDACSKAKSIWGPPPTTECCEVCEESTTDTSENEDDPVVDTSHAENKLKIELAAGHAVDLTAVLVVCFLAAVIYAMMFRFCACRRRSGHVALRATTANDGFLAAKITVGRLPEWE